MKHLRLLAIRHGLIKPHNLTESREAFPFPVALYKQDRKPVWVGRHLERVDRNFPCKN